MGPQTNPFLARFADAPAMVAPERRDEFEASLGALAADAAFSEELAARRENAGDPFWDVAKYYRPYVVAGGILTIPVRGVLLNDFPYQVGGYATGYGYIGKALARGLTDPEVKGIAFVINSPGGEVAGNFDLADAIFAARGTKPLRSFAAEAAYSAAYSIASATDLVSVARTGGVGSIGVVTTHVDVSKALEEGGIKVTFIYAGAHKVDGNAFEPLPEGVRTRIQKRVDALYAVFVSAVARNRSMPEQAVRDTEALTFMANEALSNGLADHVGSLESALAEFSADVSNPLEGEDTMSDSKPVMTVASVKADYPDVANALIAEGKDSAKAENNAAIDAAVATDRSRIAGLDGLAAKFGNTEKVAGIVTAAKADGSTVEATAMKLIDAGAHKTAGALAALEKDGDATATATPAAPAAAGTAVPQTPDGWKAEYEGSEKLKADFPYAGAYVAFKKDEQRRKGGAS